MAGILALGTYLPARRLARSAIGAALGQDAGAGERAVAAPDEDAVTLAVEAARHALRDVPAPAALYFATTSPPYADKTNATTVHAALDLDERCAAYDMGASVRSALGAFRSAWLSARGGEAVLAVAGEVRTGRPGSMDERDGGDAGAAALLGPGGPVLAEVLAHEARTAELLDRWRVPGETASSLWEERFGETAYVPLARAAFQAGLEAAGVTPQAVSRVAVAGLHRRAVRSVAKALGGVAVIDDGVAEIGNAGAAQPLLLLHRLVEGAAPGEVLVLLTLADGADCIVLRGGEALGSGYPRQPDAPALPLSYPAFLTWRGLLDREPPRRPDPPRPAAPPSHRNSRWKFGLVGSRCAACGTRHLPPERVCLECRSVDQMDAEPVADVAGTVATFTVDHLAHSIVPPVVVGVVDLDGGGRLQCELTDVDPDAVRVGDRVEMTFRRLYTTTDGVHDYFWKARPVRTASIERS